MAVFVMIQICTLIDYIRYPACKPALKEHLQIKDYACHAQLVA